jgi:hypothetical protein
MRPRPAAPTRLKEAGESGEVIFSRPAIPGLPDGLIPGNTEVAGKLTGMWYPVLRANGMAEALSRQDGEWSKMAAATDRYAVAYFPSCATTLIFSGVGRFFGAGMVTLSVATHSTERWSTTRKPVQS